MKLGFPGFPPEARTFFEELERNNNREWFQPRKERFEQFVKAPMLELVSVVNQGLERGLSDYTTEPKKAMLRIYRDTRFSADKTPYKTHMAASFSRRGLGEMGASGLFFSVNHKRIELAGGVYDPRPETLLAIRNHLAATHMQFRKAIQRPKLRKLMGELKGEELTRAPKGFQPDDPALDLIKKKRWVFHVMLSASLLTTAELAPEIIARFRIMQPVLDHLDQPLLAKKLAEKKEPRW